MAAVIAPARASAISAKPIADRPRGSTLPTSRSRHPRGRSRPRRERQGRGLRLEVETTKSASDRSAGHDRRTVGRVDPDPERPEHGHDCVAASRVAAGIEDRTDQRGRVEGRVRSETRKVAGCTRRSCAGAGRDCAGGPARGAHRGAACTREQGEDRYSDRQVPGGPSRACTSWHIHVRIFDGRAERVIVQLRHLYAQP